MLVWGHSLGTAVSSHLVADLCQQEHRPCGLVLESPFNNIFDEVLWALCGRVRCCVVQYCVVPYCFVVQYCVV